MQVSLRFLWRMVPQRIYHMTFRVQFRSSTIEILRKYLFSVKIVSDVYSCKEDDICVIHCTQECMSSRLPHETLRKLDAILFLGFLGNKVL